MPLQFKNIQRIADVVAAGAFLKGSPPMLRTIIILMLNYAINVAIHQLTGNPVPWFADLALDTISAVIVLIHPAGRIQALIGVTYIITCTLHIAYGLTVIRAFSHAAEISYLGKLWYVEAIQILLMGGWIIGKFGKSCAYWLLFGRGRDPDSPHPARLE